MMPGTKHRIEYLELAVRSLQEDVKTLKDDVRSIVDAVGLIWQPPSQGKFIKDPKNEIKG